MHCLNKQLFLALCISLSVLHPVGAQESEYEFDVSSFQRKAFELKGYVQFLGEYIDVNADSALYQLRFDAGPPYDWLGQATGSLELEGSYKQDTSTVLVRTYSSRYWDDVGGSTTDHNLYEAYYNLQPHAGLSIDLGKQVRRWGTGYAWNPVGFIERKKDPSDPELSREGYWMGGMDVIHSRSGDLATMAATLVVLPNNGDANEDFGKPHYNNIAGRLYLFYKDTDIHLMALSNGSKSARYGIDFASNIAPHFELHGEYAYITNAQRVPLTVGCTTADKVIGDVSSYLLGMRYRTENDVNHIVEYYYNGEGYTEDELRQYYTCVHQAWETLNVAQLDKLAAGGGLNSGAFTSQNPMRRYLHLKSWWVEPYDILYFAPGVQVFYNLDDGSYSIAPEVQYTGVENLQMRARIVFNVGDRLTEFGEKLGHYKVEIRLRYYF